MSIKNIVYSVRRRLARSCFFFFLVFILRFLFFVNRTSNWVTKTCTSAVQVIINKCTSMRYSIFEYSVPRITWISRSIYSLYSFFSTFFEFITKTELCEWLDDCNEFVIAKKASDLRKMIDQKYVRKNREQFWMAPDFEKKREARRLNNSGSGQSPYPPTSNNSLSAEEQPVNGTGMLLHRFSNSFLADYYRHGIIFYVKTG